MLAKKRIRVLSFIMVALFLLAFPSDAFALELSEKTDVRAQAEKMVYENIALFAPHTEGTWNENTQINEVTLLYDLDDNVNGYIFDLTTNGKATGYTQVDYLFDELIVSSFSYHAENDLEVIPESEELEDLEAVND